MLAERPVGRVIIEIADVVGFHIVEIHPAQQPPAPCRVGMDAELVGESRVGGVLDVVLGGIEAVVRVGEIVNVAAAEVVGDVAAAVVVMGVVDEAVHLAVEQSAGVDQLKLRQASAQRPGGQTEVVAVVLGRKLGGYILGDIGLGDERPLGLERLRRVLHQQTPIVVDVVGEADTRAAVGGLVPVVLHQAFVAGAEGDRLLVHVQRHAGCGPLGSRHRHAGLLGGAAADVKLLLAGAVAGAHHVRQILDVLVEGLDPQVPQIVAGDRLNGDRNVLGALGPLGRGDDDFLDLGVGNACGGAG